MASSKGDAGTKVHTVFGDFVNIVGDHGNNHSPVRTDPTGIEVNGYSIGKTTGMSQVKSAIPKHTALDNSGDFHGGTFTNSIMNSLHYEVGNGGITFETGGNFTLTATSGLFNIMAPVESCFTSDLIKLNTTNMVMVNGPILYVNTEETIFDKNVTFGGNILVNGGAAINGELITPHITTQRQLMFTADSSSLLGYPMMGAQLMCVITSPNPLMNGPATIIFLPSMNPIVSIPPHDHMFDGPACTLTDGITDLFSKMKTAEGPPIEASPAMPMDIGLSGLVNKYKQKIMKKATDFLSNAIGL